MFVPVSCYHTGGLPLQRHQPGRQPRIGSLSGACPRKSASCLRAVAYGRGPGLRHAAKFPGGYTAVSVRHAAVAVSASLAVSEQRSSTAPSRGRPADAAAASLRVLSDDGLYIVSAEEPGDRQHSVSYPAGGDQAEADADRRASNSQASTATSQHHGQHQQHRRRQTGRTASAPGDKYELMTAIKACRQWHQLHAVLREHETSLNFMHVSAAMTHLAQLISRQSDGRSSAPAELVWLVQRLTYMCLHHLWRFKSRQASNTLWAIAKLRPVVQAATDDAQSVPVSAVSPKFIERLQQLTPGFGEQDVSNVIYALGELGHAVEPKWLADLLKRSR